MEVTQKIRDMIMSDDKEMRNLLNVIIDENSDFSYCYKDSKFNLHVPHYYAGESICGILRFEIKKIEGFWK